MPLCVKVCALVRAYVRMSKGRGKFLDFSMMYHIHVTKALQYICIS